MNKYFISILSLFLACGSDSDPNPSTLIESMSDIKIDYITRGGEMFTDFEYENNLLTKILVYDSYLGEVYLTREFSYDGDNRLLHMTDVYSNSKRLYDFTWEDGRIVKCYETRDTDSYESYDIYMYTDGLLTEFAKMEVGDGYEIEASRNQYIYTDGILKEIYVPASDVTVMIETDDKKNPFYGMPYRAMDIFSYPVYARPLANNIISGKSVYGESNFEYTYNSEGYPVSVIDADNLLMEFFYK